MGQTTGLAAALREHILSDPEAVLDDREIMSALIAANERALGHNIVDLRGIAMQRLEVRLDRLEETHRQVIAAAYENLAGMNQIHRAILKMLDPLQFEDFLAALGTEIADVLRVASLRLVLESAAGPGDPALLRHADVILVAEEGFVERYMAGRAPAARPIVLRQVLPEDRLVHGAAAGDVRSEALMRLDLGAGRLPGMLVMGSEDPHQFKANQGTDLLAFFAAVFERAMRRWLG
ncbi:MAG: DUF484 family protein [Rhodobacteraceae bacterium]|nr:DUF484 family protein [Paracoccaceae bacterium]